LLIGEVAWQVCLFELLNVKIYVVDFVVGWKAEEALDTTISFVVE
jgi:hypothetical protein|tara:strand:+ start:699 stop:833 length:135 start_codon:yes stop_codon:yes gene_type:complete